MCVCFLCVYLHQPQWISGAILIYFFYFDENCTETNTGWLLHMNAACRDFISGSEYNDCVEKEMLN